ncbi:MAG: cell division protein ZapA [Gammaproteobacteria bacterium]|nr:cell division protein ZapA [Gammaproteobacteria bacterium]
MSSDEVIPITVRILDKDYQVACPDDERGQLMDSARYLDDKMKEIRNSGKVIGSDRVAVMAALNITHDLLECKSRLLNGGKPGSEKLKQLQDKVESALNRCKQLEL